MTDHENPTPGVDPSTLRNVPEGLFDTRAEQAGPSPTPATDFTPPYADAVEAPAAATPAAAAPPVADTPYVAAWADADTPTLPPTTPAEQASFAPEAASAALGAEAPRSTASLLRRWGAPAALVAAGLVGGMAVTTAVTSASASTPAPSSVQRDAGQPGSSTGGQRGGVLPGLSGSDDAAGSGSTDGSDGSDGLTIDELTPDAVGGYDGDGDGDHGRGGPGQGGYSLSDGFSLRDGSSAPSTQGGTGASR